MHGVPRSEVRKGDSVPPDAAVFPRRHRRVVRSQPDQGRLVRERPQRRAVGAKQRHRGGGGADSLVSWTQENGQDVYAPTKEILGTPPIATIPPGGEQILRLGMRRAPDPVNKLAYRVFLREVPPPPKPGFQGLQVALRLSLPIFVQPRQGPAKATLVWNLELQGDDTLQLRLDNKGTGHIQISEIALYQPGQEQPVASQSSLVYVLAGQSHAWVLKTQTAHLKPTDRLRLKVTTDAGSVDTDIDLGSH